MDAGLRVPLWVSGLLYLAALGIALFCFSAGLRSVYLLGASSPSGWALGVGLWFITNHILQLLSIRHRPRYSDGRELAVDLVNCSMLLLAFAALKFLESPLPLGQVWAVYLVFIGMPLVAVISRLGRGMTWLGLQWLVSSLIVIFLGLDYFRFGLLVRLFTPNVTNAVLLVAMFLLLWARQYRVQIDP